jgi:hypothetical protein
MNAFAHRTNVTDGSPTRRPVARGHTRIARVRPLVSKMVTADRMRASELPGGASPFPTSTNNIHQTLELFSVDAERPHVGAHEIFAEILVHLDDHRARHATSRHDQVIAFDALFNASQQPRDVA